MEGSLPNTSAIEKSHESRHAIYDVLVRIGIIFIVSFCLGGVIQAVARFASYDRIVVFNQPTATTVIFPSVRLTKPGFVVVQMQTDGGWKTVGASWYLIPGYYKDMVVDIGLHEDIPLEDKDKTDGNFVARSFVARLFVDTGTPYVYEDGIDESVKNRSGAAYQKKFWFVPKGNNLKQLFTWLWDDPFGYSLDLIWPY